MLEMLVSFVQSICLIGYLYGAWLVITHRPDAGPVRGRESGPSPQGHADEELAWRRYLAYDS